MCGIAGYFSPHIKDGRSVLKKMTDAIIHRGPDDEGFYINGACGLGARRLSIIDLSDGHQPIGNEDQTVVVAFNGEIYNFQSLRDELIGKGHKFSSKTDTEVIVHLYEEKGIDCLRDLNGMFAFALHDRKKDLIFLARDRMGEKPLHYYYKNGEFVFGSEIKSILTFPGMNTGWNLEALNLYLTYEYVPAPYSIYEGVHKLEAGHYLTLDRSGLKTACYWKPSFKHSSPELSLDENVKQLRDHMERSTAMRTVSDVPLGAFLSGGIDSSLVASILSRQSSRRIQTFSIGFEEASFDESSHARKVSEFLGTDHHEERLTSKNMLSILPAIMRGLDEPFADGSMIPTYLLCQFARKGVKVALSGDGADEIFAGYPTYQAHKAAGLIPSWLRGPLKKISDLLPVSDKNISFDFKMRRFSAGISYKNPARHQIWLGSFEPYQKSLLFTPYTYEKLKQHNEFQVIQKYWDSCDSSDTIDRAGFLDMKFYLQDDILFKVDRMSMANSLEVRAPYLDHKLVEFVCNLLPELKIKKMTLKYILKKAAEGFLPASIIDRPKKGFGMPIAKWIKQDLKELFLDILSERKIRESGLFNPDYVGKLLAEHLQGKKDHRKLLWTLFVFEAWRQKI